MSQVSRIALWGCSLNVIVIVHFGQVMSPHHPDQMWHRSQVSRVNLWGCSLNVIVFSENLKNIRKSESSKIWNFHKKSKKNLKIWIFFFKNLKFSGQFSSSRVFPRKDCPMNQYIIKCHLTLFVSLKTRRNH